MTMIFEQIYLGCLAQAAYLIGSRGVGTLVDPRRDVDEYVEAAERHGLSIQHILLTHIHADFVAGHCELAARTGADIALNHRTECGFDRRGLREGDVVELGDVMIRVLETPGHTPGDLCFMVEDRADPDRTPALLTGDLLFVGDVGRPDLAGGIGYTAADMAGMMYDSLHEKILPLDDAVEIWPAHGAGSACGRRISSERSSTIGQQRLTNPALQPRSRDDFIAEITAGLEPPPRYFIHAANYNRKGPRLLSELPPPELLRPDELASVDADVQLLDCRGAEQYGRGHIAGAINIGLGGAFESWCGSLLDLERPIVLIAAGDAAAAEARLRLARVGIEHVPYRAAPDAGPIEELPQMTVQELYAALQENPGEWQVIDVRRPAEFEAGHVPGAAHRPVTELIDGPGPLDALPRDKKTAVICGSGYRSSAATYFLRKAGFEHLHNITGGMNAWLAADLPVES